MTTALAIPHSRPPAMVLRVEDLVRDFGKGHGVVRALDGVTLGFARGSFIAATGPSGSESTRPQSRPASTALFWSGVPG